MRIHTGMLLAAVMPLAGAVASASEFAKIESDVSALPVATKFMADILESRVSERLPAAKGVALKVAYRLDAGLGGEAARVTVKGSGAEIVASRPRALVYGMAQLLKTMEWKTTSFSVADGTWEIKPAKPIRVAYWARHFHNWYHRASETELNRYAEDMLLMGANGFCYQYGYPVVNRAGADPKEMDEFVRKSRLLYDHIKALDADIVDWGGGNQLPADSPEELRGEPETDPKRCNVGFNACPAKPKALEALLNGNAKRLDDMAEQGRQPKWFLHWPFDEGGCECAKCRPWGGNGFIWLCQKYDQMDKAKFPGVKTILSTWTYHDDDYAGLWDYLKKPESSWIDGLMIDSHENFPKWPLEHGIPRNLPVITFPEISMWGRWPWGGFGAIAMPARFERLFRQCEKVASGFMFYSEGLSEDINKYVVIGLYVNPRAHWQELVKEYAKMWLPGIDVDGFVKLVTMMEELQTAPVANRFMYGHGDDEVAPYAPKAKAMRELAVKLEATLLPAVRASWRWRLIQLRADVDKEILAGPKGLSPALERDLREINAIYHAEPEEGDYGKVVNHHCVRAPLKRKSPKTVKPQ